MLEPPAPGRLRLYRTLLAIGSPLLFLLLLEAGVRLSGVDTEVVRNSDFRIDVPAWLLADGNWVDTQAGRLSRRGGVRASDVAWLRHFEEARYIQYKLKPNLRAQVFNPFNLDELRLGKTFTLESNAAGFRTRPFTPKAPGARRIVTVGDSSTFGWGVEPAYTYQALLEARLAARGRPAEVLNLGLPGFTSGHGLAVVDRYALDLDPDILILSFGGNDARRVPRATDEVLARDASWLGAAQAVLLRLESFKLLRKLIFLVYESLYGAWTMEHNWRLYVTTDGCHPGRAGQSLIADALTEAVIGLL